MKQTSFLFCGGLKDGKSIKVLFDVHDGGERGVLWNDGRSLGL
jgi:hypothetical protein